MKVWSVYFSIMSRPAVPIHHLSGATPTGLRVAAQRFDQSHPTRTMSTHRHGFFELLYLEVGGGVHTVNGLRLEAATGDLYLLAPGDVHDVSGLTEAKGWLIVFEPEALGLPATPGAISLPGNLLLLSFLRPPSEVAVRFYVPRDRRAWFAGLTASLRTELAASRLGHADAVRWSLSLLLLEAARLAENHLGTLSPASRPLLERVFAFIEAHFHEPISLKDVVAAVGRSRASVTATVRRETGRSVVDWINARRLAQARLLLMETGMSIEQVALASGFSDVSYFSRLFHREIGESPGRWQEARLR